MMIGKGSMVKNFCLNFISTCGKTAFTLAEVLITLGIIGIVAAMTLPSVIGNYQKVQTISQLKKVYTTLNQAFKRSEADNESSVYWNTDKGIDFYFNQYWKPYLNILGYCRGGHGDVDCNYKSSAPWKRANGKNDAYLVVRDSDRSAFILYDGTYISILMSSGYGSAEGGEDENLSLLTQEPPLFLIECCNGNVLAIQIKR